MESLEESACQLIDLFSRLGPGADGSVLLTLGAFRRLSTWVKMVVTGKTLRAPENSAASSRGKMHHLQYESPSRLTRL
jgi:hypothetical protein